MWGRGCPGLPPDPKGFPPHCPRSRSAIRFFYFIGKSYRTRKNPALQDSPPAAGRFATDSIPAAVR